MKFLLIFLFAATAVPCFAKDTITWMNTDYPPIGIGSGVLENKGIVDKIAQALAQELPEYDHVYKRANLKRILCVIGNEKKACIAGLIKTNERAETIHYNNVSTAILTPLSIIVRTEDVKKFGDSQEVSLEAILKEDRFKIAVSEKISFSSEIDQLLEKYKANKNIKRMAMTNLIQNFLNMIANKRIDYTIGYPWMVEYVSGQLGMKGKFSSIPLRESKKPIIYYAACPKNEWGKSLAKKIDKALKKIRGEKEYRKIIEEWMAPASLSDYRKRYDDFLQE